MWTRYQEFTRKIFHLLALSWIGIYVWLSKIWGSREAMFVLVGLFAFYLLYEYLRLEKKIDLPLNNIFRPQEQERFGSAVYLFLSIIICLGIFQFRMALAALLMFVISDAIGAFIGVIVKEDFLRFKNGKNAVSLIVEFLVAFIIGFFILPIWWIIFPLSLSMAVLESFTSNKFEDNLLPIVIGLAGELLLFFV